MLLPESLAAKPTVASARIAVGLAQGFALYLLYQAADRAVWPATDGLIFAPLLLVFLFVPVIFLLGAGSMRLSTLFLWGGAATVVLAGMAWHDIARGGEAGDWRLWAGGGAGPRIIPSPILIGFTMVGLFIAQSLIAAGDADRKLLAHYPRYFEAAWKHAVQLVLASLFVGLFWGILQLGAGLFQLIKLTFLTELIQHRWFAIPATTLAEAAAIHVTDVRVGLLRGIRTVLHALLSWLLPLLALIVFGFLASLPFTGLAPLWSTRFATGLLLTVAALLTLLTNAAYQDGTPEHRPPRIMRYAGSVAAVMLIPLVAIATYALALRVQQHGWTTDRIIAAACVTVGAVHALGYGFAALRPGPWLKPIELVNVLGAATILAVLLALLTPIADPARLAVASQIARLESGAIAPEQFDFASLRFDGARYGREALERLKAGDHGEKTAFIREQADKALRLQNRWQPNVVAPTPVGLAANVTVYPAGRTLPDSFVQQDWSKALQPSWSWMLQCLSNQSDKCEAFLTDLDGDGVDEIILVSIPSRNGRAVVFKMTGDGRWTPVGPLSPDATCGDVLVALRAGQFKAAPHAWNDIDVAGRRLAIESFPFNMTPRNCR